MTPVEIPGIKDAEFEATAAVDGGSLVMRLWGNADLRVNGPLGPFLDQVDDQARRNHMGEVVADFRELATRLPIHDGWRTPEFVAPALHDRLLAKAAA